MQSESFYNHILKMVSVYLYEVSEICAVFYSQHKRKKIRLIIIWLKKDRRRGKTVGGGNGSRY